MSSVFADTCFWVALTSTHDAMHEQAMALAREFSDARIHTTEQVITEYLNFFAGRGQGVRRRAAENVRAMLVNPLVTVVPHTKEVFRAGIALYGDRPDKGYSLTDCISMIVMQGEGLREALTNDRHFEQEGFRALLRDTVPPH